MLTIVKTLGIADLKNDALKIYFGIYAAANYSMSIGTKFSVHYTLYLKTINVFGTTKKHREYI
jgi:hypothetical protein